MMIIVIIFDIFILYVWLIMQMIKTANFSSE